MNMIEKLIQNLKQLDIEAIIQLILTNPYIQEWITDTVTGRLYETGRTSSFKRLRTNVAIKQQKRYARRKERFYATTTEKIKKEKGQPVDRVTLKDSGDFYDSFKIKADKRSFSISADLKNGAMYDNFSISFRRNEFTKEILGLSRDEQATLNQKIVKELFVKFLYKQIVKGLT